MKKNKLFFKKKKEENPNIKITGLVEEFTENFALKQVLEE